MLRFYAYFREDVPGCSEEDYRIRPVVIYYYLEDDTMCIYEPVVENSGMPQGKRLKRQRIPKNEHGGYYRWTDLNLAIDLEVFGVKYHIIQCDGFTKVANCLLAKSDYWNKAGSVFLCLLLIHH